MNHIKLEEFQSQTVPVYHFQDLHTMNLLTIYRGAHLLQIFVKHNIRIRGASTPLKAAITKALTFDNPAYLKAKQRRPTWGVQAKLELFYMTEAILLRLEVSCQS